MDEKNLNVFVNAVESEPLIGGRYSSAKLMNVTNGESRGNFSLVFKAIDIETNNLVAIKFLKSDFSSTDDYRRKCFHREADILESLSNVKRCLQLVAPVQVFDLKLPLADGETFTVPMYFFVTEWIEKDIDRYFLCQDSTESIDKLKLFNQVVLAVEALHVRDIFHRDLKVDNLRERSEELGATIVAIDLGTAAKIDSQPVFAAYNDAVGNTFYAPPEARCGLASIRKISHLSDVYTLGCMLYELFNIQDHPSAYHAINPEYEYRVQALRAKVGTSDVPSNHIASWDRSAPHLLIGLNVLSIADGSHTVPRSIEVQLQEVYASLVAPNFRNRVASLKRLRERIWLMIRCLENESIAKKKAEIASRLRLLRRQSALQKAARVASRESHLSNRNASMIQVKTDAG